MAANTSIEWTDATWSPIRVRVKQNAADIAMEKGYTSLIPIVEKMAGRAGPHCEKVSSGCDNCYAATNNHRCLPANGTGLPYDRRSRDLVEAFVDEKVLFQPLSWKTPRKIFVENQSDIFGEWVTDEMLDQVHAIVALCPQHTFQFLTKRPARQWDYYYLLHLGYREAMIGRAAQLINQKLTGDPVLEWSGLPLPNMWAGVSAEDQPTWDERVPAILRIPAAFHFVSYEPGLGPIDHTKSKVEGFNPLAAAVHKSLSGEKTITHVDWIIIGGESGPGARGFDVDWARNTISQCADWGVACFVKQLGTKPYITREHGMVDLVDRKGGDMDEWPEDLCVREFPEVQA